MKYREATIDDIAQIQVVRNSVKENVLSDPKLVTDEACREYLNERGKGWACETDLEIVGFAIADLEDNNIWALFLKPEFEGRGIGRKLHKLMLDWYFFTGKKMYGWEHLPIPGQQHFTGEWAGQKQECTEKMKSNLK